MRLPTTPTISIIVALQDVFATTRISFLILATRQQDLFECLLAHARHRCADILHRPSIVHHDLERVVDVTQKIRLDKKDCAL